MHASKTMECLLVNPEREREIYRAALNVAVLGNKAAAVDEDREEEYLVTIEMACRLFQSQEENNARQWILFLIACSRHIYKQRLICSQS